ncbi:MAG: ATP-binding cassette domain-containing protein, partial [Hoeflea sp.]|nr:ATP-binding cassette domain-containing protein [Hoeflea sp.]
MLSVTDLTASYGAIRAVQGINLTVASGSLSVILGSNGAGKSTTLRSIAGLHRPIGGSVMLDGRNISKLALHNVVRAGLALEQEGRMVVAQLTEEENLIQSRISGRKGT